MRFRLLALTVLCLFGAACANDGDTAPRELRLLRAAKNGDMAVMAKLLDEGADIETRNPGDAWTPLMWVAARDNAAGVKLLLSRGAQIEARDSKGLTALLVAGRWSKREGAAALLDGGADIGALDRLGWTALMWAAFKGQTEMAAFLLDRGAPVETRDADGRTSLMLAAKKGHDGIVDLLLARGASLSARGPDGKTAAELAETNGYDDLAKRLRAASSR